MPKTLYGNTIKHRLHTAVSLRPLYLLIFYVHAQYLRAERFCSWCLWNEISLLPFVSQNQSCGGVIRTKSSWVYSEQRPFTFVYTPVISSKDISCGEFRVIMYQIRSNSVIHLLFFIVYLVCWSAYAVKCWTLCHWVALHCLSHHLQYSRWGYSHSWCVDIAHWYRTLYGYLTIDLTVVACCCEYFLFCVRVELAFPLWRASSAPCRHFQCLQWFYSNSKQSRHFSKYSSWEITHLCFSLYRQIRSNLLNNLHGL